MEDSIFCTLGRSPGKPDEFYRRGVWVQGSGEVIRAAVLGDKQRLDQDSSSHVTLKSRSADLFNSPATR